MSSSSRFVFALFGLSLAACTLDRGGAGLTSTVGSSGGSGGAGAAGSSQGGSSAGSSAVGGNQSFGGSSGGSGAAGGSGGVGAAAGVGGTGGITTGGVGGAVGNESNCTDGVDEDQDGMTDCADSDCAGYECVDSTPTGWTGYFRLREHSSYDPSAPKLPCAGGLSPARYFTDPVAPTCTACSCAPLNGATCGDTPIFCATGNKSCNNPSDWTSSLADGGCHKPGGGNQGSCYLGQPSVTDAGTCQPQGGEVVDTPLFGGMIDICGESTSGGGGCGAQTSCVERASLDYIGFVCVRQMGVHDCPSGWNIRRVASANGTDGRTCSSCSCSPNTTCSPGTYKVYDFNDCTGDDSTISSTSCGDISGRMDFSTWALKRNSRSVVGGDCTPSGGVPGGQVDLTGTQTFCCRP